ncbi:DUF2524 domain-containing protein [Paenibacillus sp. CGMCC 1.16610]|uniref:DUF2524 domain-containing protein n=2 Tax=Paenibacillus TaxID=44249 RepID=A0ABU3RAW6_9BACL|nr:MULTISPECIES: DUF2524 domain-containing protein [Paenibacillus]MBA2937884.1 DUF2524 domain-containing protein [Paenibacillus sp. CGMCC 1.16610]MDU0201405.1 DUF2524 domain-containing protein [Paenibacillus sp. PFR10]MEC0269359.1 DUF2524 domain-containing protein [Paenibacillus anseongense]MVQ36942.1 DUF2524 domain-containing protein [Paenibacillus anseongense]
MLNDLDSNYDCANAGNDLHNLIQELEQFEGPEEQRNRLENQIHFIQNKCSITHEHFRYR